MDFYQRGKIEVKINGESIGYVSAIDIRRQGGMSINLIKESVDTVETVDTQQSYDDFFNKFKRVFSKDN
jgi:hypothetical protein